MLNTGKIQRLEEEVINRIAAGEVIQRPANAVKELLENCLDAKSTSIQVLLGSGGLKKIIITDNGTGIQREDMDIVCERFTTSKLRKFEDLTGISTYGFRGEALASITHVAHVTITSKTADSECTYKASYQDGKVKGAIKPCAGNQGTQINVEDLFYNVPVRRKALQNASQEHAKVADMFGKYAIHNSGIAFHLQKIGNTDVDIRTFVDAAIEENIRSIYGSQVSRELLKVESEDSSLGFKMFGLITNANFSVKRMIFLLFINNRLVDSTAMRKVIDSVYANYLPKKGFPFIYLSLNVKPENVDVNVHPTKHEVHFLNEELILQNISQAVEKTMRGCNSSRTLYVQTMLPSTLTSLNESTSSTSDRVYDHNLVRTDSAEQKLDSFINRNKLPTSLETSSMSLDDITSEEIVTDEQPDDTVQSSKSATPKRREMKLSSVVQLKKEIENNAHSGLRQLFKYHKFGACVNKEHSLVQYKTGLYLTNVPYLSEELFYQIVIADFGNFGMMKLEDPAPLKSLVVLALDSAESGWTEELGTKEDLSVYVANLLISKAELLNDYFSIKIDQDGNLHSLPLLIDDYIPDMNGLPMFVLRLATEVDWDTEKNCFETFSREVAKFYKFHKNFTCLELYGDNAASDDNSSKDKWKWVVEHVLFPAFKSVLNPPKQFAEDGCILEIAELSRLYKVFERC